MSEVPEVFGNYTPFGTSDAFTEILAGSANKIKTLIGKKGNGREVAATEAEMLQRPGWLKFVVRYAIRQVPGPILRDPRQKKQVVASVIESQTPIINSK